MNIRLTGYFDKNFGDDLMQLIVVENMPEDHFFVDCPQREFLTHFDGRENVRTDSGESADAYVNVIGTGFQYPSKMNRITKFLSIPGEKKLRYRKTAVIDCSVDLPENAAERWLIQRELNKYRLISCRDSVSEAMIANMAKKSQIKRHEDLVFALDQKYLAPLTDEGCLGVIPVQRGFSDVNFSYYKTLAAACDRFVEEESKPVLLFALDTGNENDTLAAMSVKRLMRHADAAEIIAYNSEPEFVFRQMARCAKIISSRFHGVVAAVLAGVPAAAVSDTTKIDLLAEKLGFNVLKKSALTEEGLISLIRQPVQPVPLPETVRQDAREHLTELREYLRG